MNTPVTAGEARQPAFQMWMVANVAVGAGWAAFVALLVPPDMTEAAACSPTLHPATTTSPCT